MRYFGSVFPAPFSYRPDLAAVGSKSTYFPRDVSQDAAALNYLGFLSDADYASIKPSTGTMGGDQATNAGAWDGLFRAAVTKAQTIARLTVDSWVGPQTRTGILALVLAKNQNPNVPTPQLPAVIPVNPGQVPANPNVLPGVTPASSTTGGDNSGMYILGGLVVAAGLAYVALSD